MKGYIQNMNTPQQKMVAVNNKFGNSNIKSQQGTTRTLFDALPLDSRTTFNFFESASLRQFPLTNIGSEGNRLEVGSTFTIEKIYFALVTYASGTNTITAISPGFSTGVAAFDNVLSTGEINFTIANSQVIKQLPATFSGSASFNPTANNTADVAFGFATDIVIPPLLEYIAQLRTTSYDLTGVTATHIQCFIQGTAGIIAPQTTF